MKLNNGNCPVRAFHKPKIELWERFGNSRPKSGKQNISTE